MNLCYLRALLLMANELYKTLTDVFTVNARLCVQLLERKTLVCYKPKLLQNQLSSQDVTQSHTYACI